MRILIFVETHWVIGDAAISFRFSEQFASGHGLVFNTGERVSGNTSLFYTLLLGIAGACGISIEIFARVIGIVSDVAATILVWRILTLHTDLKTSAWRFLIPIVLFLFPMTIFYSVSGMETSLYVALCFLLVERTLTPVGWGWYVTAGLLMFCRPDSVIVVGSALLFLTIKNRKLPWRPGLVAFCIGLVYLAFNWAYYGSLVPNTMLAKSVAYHSSIGENFHVVAARFVRSDTVLALWLVAAGCVIACLRKNGPVMLLGILSAGSFLFVLKTPLFRSWYAVPFFEFSLVLLAIGCARLFECKLTAIPNALIVSGAVAYVCVCCVVVQKSVVPLLAGIHESDLETEIAVGSWLRENTPADARVLVTALETGYYSKRYTLDVPGLVTPEVWKKLKQNRNTGYFELADALKADYVVTTGDSSEKPPANFEFIRDFKPLHPRPSFDIAYALYKRNPATQ